MTINPCRQVLTEPTNAAMPAGKGCATGIVSRENDSICPCGLFPVEYDFCISKFPRHATLSLLPWLCHFPRAFLEDGERERWDQRAEVSLVPSRAEMEENASRFSLLGAFSSKLHVRVTRVAFGFLLKLKSEALDVKTVLSK